MNSPRFPIKALLFLVVLAALDFAAFRAMGDLGRVSRSPEFAAMLLLGVLPPANLLVIEKLFRGKRTDGGSRGFDWVGLSVLLFWFVVATVASRPIMELMVSITLLLTGTRGGGILAYLIVIPLLSAPPVVLTLLLRRLFRVFENIFKVSIVIERRQAPLGSP